VIFKTFFYLSLLLGVPTVQGQTSTNQELVERMTESLLDSAFSSMADVSTLRISLNAELIEGERKIFLFNNLVGYLDNQNQSVHLDSSDITLVVDRFDIDITYLEKSLRLLGLNRTIQRQVEVTLNGHIHDHISKRAGLPFSYSSMWDDRISSDKIVHVENSPYNLFRGRLVKAIYWTKYIEPAVVIVSVATLIYIFFSVRY
jgi:hypothetical protein